MLIENFIGGAFDFSITRNLWFLAWLTSFRDALITRVRRVRGSLRRILRRWPRWDGTPAVKPPFPHGARPWNRTPDDVEASVCRLHIELDRPGARTLASMIYRVYGRALSHQTVWRILARRRDLVREMRDGRGERPGRIDIPKPRVMWGLDLVRICIVGFVPVWIVAVVDYRGSRLLMFHPIGWRARTEDVVAVLRRVFAEHSKPKRILTDNGLNLCSDEMNAFLGDNGVRHQRTKPYCPWTNGRIERVFRTAKETFFGLVWLIRSRAQLDRFCRDFLTWYNRDRPHASYNGKTPDEVFFGRAKKPGFVERVSYFDGLMPRYRFG